jgi:hypothetical protein
VSRPLRLIFVLGLAGASLALVAWAFAQLPIDQRGYAIDWKQLWADTRFFTANYDGKGLFNPPWVLPLLWPLSALPLAFSWAVLGFATLNLLMLSVPRQSGRGLWLAGVALVVLSYPALRQLVDGNLEVLIIGGVLLMLWALPRQHTLGMAAGMLLAAAKIQESWLLLAVAAILIAREWAPRQWLRSLGWGTLLAGPLLLFYGRDWWVSNLSFTHIWPGTPVDSSIYGLLLRFGLPTWLWVLAAVIILSAGFWATRRRGLALGRLDAGWLLAAGLLLAPYAASNSVLTVLAIGVIPLFQRRPLVGLALILLYDLPLLTGGNAELRLVWEASYWTLVLILSWGVLLFLARRENSQGHGSQGTGTGKRATSVPAG